MGKLVEDIAVQSVLIGQGIGRHGGGVRVDNTWQTLFNIVHRLGDTSWQTLE